MFTNKYFVSTLLLVATLGMSCGDAANPISLRTNIVSISDGFVEDALDIDVSQAVCNQFEIDTDTSGTPPASDFEDYTAAYASIEFTPELVMEPGTDPLESEEFIVITGLQVYIYDASEEYNDIEVEEFSPAFPYSGDRIYVGDQVETVIVLMSFGQKEIFSTNLSAQGLVAAQMTLQITVTYQDRKGSEYEHIMNSGIHMGNMNRCS